MTLILTAPERIALMAKDAHAGIVFTEHLFVPNLDPNLLPAVLISIGEFEAPATASNMEFPSEVYTLDYFGKRFNTPDDGGAAELLARTHVAALTLYFWKRTQLQFSNTRAISGLTALGPLAGVQWARIKRGPIGLVDRSDFSYWGCTLTLTVQEIANAYEVLIPRT